jgi:hypothetical protein
LGKTEGTEGCPALNLNPNSNLETKKRLSEVEEQTDEQRFQKGHSEADPPKSNPK